MASDPGNRKNEMTEKHLMRPSMPVSQRAKQFMPFAAVTGLDDALRRKERELGLSERPDVTDEDAAAINERLAFLGKGEEVGIVYYCAGEYETAEGIVRSVDTAFRRIALEEADDSQGSQTVRKRNVIEIDMEDIIEIRTEQSGERR